MSNLECGRKKEERDCCGLWETLAVIHRLQQNADTIDETLATCDRPFLGPEPCVQCFNTRPVILYTADNKPWEMPIDDDCPVTSLANQEEEMLINLNSDPNLIHTSTVFRLEKLGPCTATFRVLIVIEKGRKCIFKRTNTFFTVNLCCFCAIRCLPDTFVPGIC